MAINSLIKIRQMSCKIKHQIIMKIVNIKYQNIKYTQCAIKTNTEMEALTVLFLSFSISMAIGL